MPTNGPGDEARNKLLELERRRQLAVVSEFEKIQTRLTSEISDLLDRIDKQRRFEGNASPAGLFKKARLSELLDQVTAEINAASARLAGLTESAQSSAIDVAGTEAAKYPQLKSGLVTFDAPATRAIVGLAGNGQPLAVHFAKIAAPARQAMFDALFFGVAAGTPNQAIAREVKDAIGGTSAAAMTIVRTETNRSYREATREFYTSAPSVIGWRWLAALDLNTCPICWGLHGRIFKTNTKFGTHPNCRCTMVPVFKGDAKQPTGPELFAKLNEAQQRTIVGPRRLDLYRQGAELSDFIETNKSAFGIGRQVKPISRTTFKQNPRELIPASVERLPAPAPVLSIADRTTPK
jgi:SPP1 gp7 family putative phage head morphogenesis protein